MKKGLFSSLLITLLIAFSHGSYAQLIHTIAGNGTAGHAGDGGPAYIAELDAPVGFAIDPSGNIYIADAGYHCVRRIDASSGIITTIAGTGTAGSTGDGGPATAALLNTPAGVTLDGAGNIYICDQLNGKIRKITATTGVISTVVGIGTLGYGGDGGPATAATINRPYSMIFDASGNMYIADRSNDRVRMVNTSGTISTFAGSGTVGFAGDGGAASATTTRLNRPVALAFDASNNLYIVDNGNNRIRMVNGSGIINTVAGTGGSTYAGDGYAATVTGLNQPNAIAFDASGNYYISDAGNNAIRMVSSGIITTVAGTGVAGDTTDCQTPTSTKLDFPSGLQFNSSGTMFISDGGNNKLRKVTLPCSSRPTAGTATATASTGCPFYSSVVYLPGTPGGCYYNYQWMASSDGITYSLVSGATSSSYAPTLSNTIYLKCSVTCNSLATNNTDTSAAVMLNVNHPFAISPVAGPTDVCAGTTNLVTDTASTGTWYASNTVVTVGASSGIVTAGVVPGRDTITYTATNVCGTVTSSLIMTVDTTLTPSVMISSFPGTSVCFGTSVTYTANPTNGGTAPTYQWFVNGVYAGSGSSLTYTPTVHDSISCVMTSSVPCPTSTTVSAYVNMNVVSLLTPSIVISDGILGDSVCRGVPVTFYSTITNGGASPTYQWYVNGALYATTPNYTYVPNDTDVLACYLTSSFGCAAPATVGDSLRLTVDTIEYPAIWITSFPGDSSCYGYNVTFTAHTRYGGLAPQFRWVENGIAVATGPTYTYAPNNGDSVYCILFSSASCKNTDSAFSDTIHMTVQPSDTLKVTIAAHPGTLVTLGQRDTLVATVLNGGASPTYQWYKNGVAVAGANSSTYITDTIAENDLIYCFVHGSYVCATPTVVNSNRLLFHLVTGIQEPANETFDVTLAPNPNTGTFTLNGLTSVGSGHATVQVSNIIGSVIYNGAATIENGRFSQHVALESNAASGIYFVKVTVGTHQQVFRITLDK